MRTMPGVMMRISPATHKRFITVKQQLSDANHGRQVTTEETQVALLDLWEKMLQAVEADG
jgi:hypothetical protein